MYCEKEIGVLNNILVDFIFHSIWFEFRYFSWYGWVMAKFYLQKIA